MPRDVVVILVGCVAALVTCALLFLRERRAERKRDAIARINDYYVEHRTGEYSGGTYRRKG